MQTLFRKWWVILIQGILLIGLSMYVFSHPGITLAAIALWLSVLILISGVAGLLGRADEVGNGIAADLDDAVAQPAHAARMFDAIGFGKAEILVDVGAYFVGVEMNRIQARREHLRQGGLSRAGQPHDQDFLFHTDCLADGLRGGQHSCAAALAVYPVVVCGG